VKRRAQASGSSAATLIGLITLCIIFYILFLPPQERKALLDEKSTDDMPGGVPGIGEFLFRGAPGKLSFVGQTDFTHLIPNIILTEERQAQIIAESNPFIVKKGWFRRQFKNITFVLPDLNTVDNVVLSFQAPIRTGRLKILFNGVPVFENTLKSQNPQPILLPRSILRTTNTLEFQVWGFGLLFPREYALEDIKIIGEITDVRKQMAANSFSIPEIEYDNMESGYLGFYPVCDQNDVGVLDVSLNDHVIYSGVPVCDSPAREDLFSEDLRQGKNSLGFKLKSGVVRLEQMLVKTFVKPTKGYSDFFFVEPDVFTAIATGRAHAIMEVEFVDDGRIKDAQTNVNGRLDILSQREPKFARDISAVIRDGNNFIGIEPGSDLNVISIQVRVE